MRMIAICAWQVTLAAAALAQSAGNPSHSSPETHGPAAPAVCDGKDLPMKLKDGSTGVPVKCCRGRDDVLVQEGRGATGLAFRLRGTRCSNYKPKPQDACEVSGQCDFGPCGVAPLLPVSGTEQHVFKPEHAVKACGYQIKLEPNSGGVDQFDAYPEPYRNTEQEYPLVTPACPYTACDGHRPAITVSVTTVANQATGTVKSQPEGISLSQAGTASKKFADPITITANPKGPDARAVLSGGGCAVNGGFGETVHCNVPLAPDPEVTVTFECKPGQTCQMQ